MLSVVVPLFNEQDTLRELYHRIKKVLGESGVSHEILFVNDGSTDASWNILLELRQSDNAVKVLDLTRNFGHQNALIAGLEHAEGDAVITLDADLQHPPELIPEMISKWREGYNIVYTCRNDTVRAGPLKKISSRLYYAALNCISEVNIPPGTADFRLLDRTALEGIQKLREHTLFLRGLISWLGYRQAVLYYSARPRYAGKSKYSLLRMLRFSIDGITSLSSLPLYFSAFTGLVISMLSFIYAMYAIYARLFTTRALPGWTSVVVAVLFLSGIQLISIGIQGAYLGRIYTEVKARPRYLVRRSCGFDRHGQ